MSKFTRRDLFRRAGCGLLGRAALVSGFDRLSMVNLLAAPSGPTDYRALVCIFLFGGNDSNNTVISIDNYPTYASSRGILAFSRQQLAATAITPKGGGNYALHPMMPELQALFSAGKVAVVANVGTLIAPITKTDYQAGVRPYQLFSHSDQQNQWQTSVSTSDTAFGWGGKMSDQTQDSSTGFPTVTSVAGVSVFSSGMRTHPVALAPAPTPLNQTLQLQHADGVFNQILSYDTSAGSPALVKAAGDITQGGVADSALLNVNPSIATVFPSPNGLANQLLQVAKLIKISSSLGLKRQIFFCSLGGFDTHTGQLMTQQTLLGQLSAAMSAFYSATAEIGVSGNVTTFTLSDFSRTFTPAGTAINTVGSDHAWGSHHFVMGDSVAGGDFYGAFPDLVVGGNQDADSGSGARGRWIPTTSVDEYAATLATWYGLSSSDLSIVFPNIGRFATSNLGFMGV